jgi:hypothetical protein
VAAHFCVNKLIAVQVIDFKFMSASHAVARSQYKLPCAPYQAGGGFDTGTLKANPETKDVSKAVCVEKYLADIKPVPDKSGYRK